MKCIGGEIVEKGTYCDFLTGKSIHMESAGTLPGGKNDRYYKLPLSVVSAHALTYAIFFPVVGMATLVGAVAGKALVDAPRRARSKGDL